MVSPMSHLRPGHTPVTNLHAPRQVPLHTVARHPGDTEQTEAQPSVPLDPPSPEGADCHPVLSHRSVRLSPISLWKPPLQLFPPFEALTRFLPGPPSQPHLTEAAPSSRPSRAGPLPCPQPQHPGLRVWSGVGRETDLPYKHPQVTPDAPSRERSTGSWPRTT